jgi:hypothetical protein
MSEDVPAELGAFISQHIGSILQLELLLQLAGDPDREWTPPDAAKFLYVEPTVALGLLEGMRQRGLVAATGDAEPRYRFAPTQPQDAAKVAQLAQFYRDRRVTLIGYIYSSPNNKLQNFADAFRFRRPT